MNLKNRLQNGDTLIGTLISLPSPEVAELMALSGFDWLFIDGEHGPMDVLTCQRMLQAVGGRVPSLVRVPGVSDEWIKKTLDIGADGVIIPKVSSAKAAQQVVQSAKYPTQGQRGVGAARAHGYGLHFQVYLSRANEDLMVVLQIEDKLGVAEIEAITDIAGVDVVFIGPYDLSASLGLTGQVDHPEVISAIGQVEAVCKAKGIPMGFFGMTPESVQPSIDKGYQLIACGTDTGVLAGGGQQVINTLKAH